MVQVMGLPRKKNYAGRWDVLIDKATKCLTRMLEVASKKKRNYIIDQVGARSSVSQLAIQTSFWTQQTSEKRQHKL
jgi:heterogeneous nuclear ribonucleoprotein U-like protein 1